MTSPDYDYDEEPEGCEICGAPLNGFSELCGACERLSDCAQEPDGRSKTIQVRLNADQYRRLYDAAFNQNISINEKVRQMIDARFVQREYVTKEGTRVHETVIPYSKWKHRQ